MLKKLIATLILLSLTFSALAHSKHENENQTQEITVKTIKITDRVYMLQGRGGNVGVSVGMDGILIIDDDYADVAPKIGEALKALGSERPKFIFNTHWHGDHTQGNKFFGKDSIIISHLNVRNRLSVDSMRCTTKILAYPKEALPMITFEQSISVHFNEDEIKAVHSRNAHTDGDSVIYFTKSNVVHMGDQFFFDRFPYVDLSSGGSVRGLMQNLADVIAKLPADVKIIPGHGQLATKDDLVRYHQTIVETVGIVEKGMQENKTLDQLKKEGFPEKYKSWGSGFIKTESWIETFYNNLSKK